MTLYTVCLCAVGLALFASWAVYRSCVNVCDELLNHLLAKRKKMSLQNGKTRQHNKSEQMTTAAVNKLNLILWDFVRRLVPGKELSNLVDHLDWVILTKETLYLLRYVPEDRSSPKVLTGKQLLKNYKLPTRLKNKTWTKPQIKNH